MASLFQVPQPSLGLMGRSRAQGRNRMPLIPGMELQGLMPPSADPIDEAMMARAAEQERVAAERRAQDEAVLASRPRERVSGWRLLDRVLGGETITEGLDSERTRLTDEANRGGGMERQRQILASITDPRERAIFLADPAEWSKNVGQQFAPQVVGAGAAQFIGGRRVGEQPTYAESGDTTTRRDSTGVTPVYTRTNPSISETTAIDKNAIDRERLDLDSRTAGYELGQGQTRYGLNNQPVASVAPSANSERRRSYEDSVGVRRFEDDGSPVFPDDAVRVRSQARARLDAASTSGNNLLSEIDKALGLAGVGETGVVGAVMGGVPGTRAARLRGAIQTIKSNIGFNYLQQMRELSPTGGALGSVAVQEMEALQSVLGNLDPNQGEEQLEANLNQVRALVAQGQALRERTFAEQYGQGGGEGAGASGPRLTPEAARALPPGTRFVGMDGVERVRQ